MRSCSAGCSEQYSNNSFKFGAEQFKFSLRTGFGAPVLVKRFQYAYPFVNYNDFSKGWDGKCNVC